MARITIIPVDNTVYVDDVPHPLDLSGCAIPTNVHALQWYDTRGWIEFNENADPFTPKEPNQDITELPAWANACLQVWMDWQEPLSREAVAATNQPNTVGTQTI